MYEEGTQWEHYVGLRTVTTAQALSQLSQATSNWV